MAEESTELKSLSASLLKTYEMCSFLYYATYVLKLPKGENDGSRRGSACHNIFELLFNPKHRKKYDKIVKSGTIPSVKSIERLIRIYAKKSNLDLNEEIGNFKSIDEMILVGLRTNFFVKGAKLLAPEYRFDIVNENPKYRIKGFIDAIFEKENKIIINDFKSSKKKFEGSDCETNIQSLMYSLAEKKIWPDKEPLVNFIFLKYPEDPIQESPYSADSLIGFEHYLAAIQNKIQNFTEKDAKSNLAFSRGYPKDNSFSGCLACGYSKFPGHTKKTGEKYWNCEFKWSFDYYTLKDKDGKIIKTSKKIEDLDSSKGTITKEFFKGCPAHNQ